LRATPGEKRARGEELERRRASGVYVVSRRGAERESTRAPKRAEKSLELGDVGGFVDGFVGGFVDVVVVVRPR
jgi:hypothetical protein